MAIRSQGWRQHTALSCDQQYFISIKTFFSIKLFRLLLEQIWGEIGDIPRSRMRHVTVMTHDTGQCDAALAFACLMTMQWCNKSTWCQLKLHFPRHQQSSAKLHSWLALLLCSPLSDGRGRGFGGGWAWLAGGAQAGTGNWLWWPGGAQAVRASHRPSSDWGAVWEWASSVSWGHSHHGDQGLTRSGCRPGGPRPWPWPARSPG